MLVYVVKLLVEEIAVPYFDSLVVSEYLRLALIEKLYLTAKIFVEKQSSLSVKAHLFSVG